MTTINICESISCPYYSRASSCAFYTYATHCHLLPDEKLQATEYALYAPEMDTSDLKTKNEAYFANSDRYQRHVYVQQHVEGMKEAMEFPSRIIPQNTLYSPK